MISAHRGSKWGSTSVSVRGSKDLNPASSLSNPSQSHRQTAKFARLNRRLPSSLGKVNMPMARLQARHPQGSDPDPADSKGTCAKPRCPPVSLPALRLQLRAPDTAEMSLRTLRGPSSESSLFVRTSTGWRLDHREARPERLGGKVTEKDTQLRSADVAFGRLWEMARDAGPPKS
jgi:hypothetical protein